MAKTWKKWLGENLWVKAGVAGGVVAFVWSTVSWMMIPWHNREMRSFSGEGEMVTAALKAEAAKPGFYMIPNMDPKNCHDKKMMERHMELAARGPYAYIMVRPEGMKCSMGCGMLVMILMSLGMGLASAFLLSKTNLRKASEKTLFVSLAMGTGIAMPHIANWAWMGFPCLTTVVCIADGFLTWAIAGAVIARMK
jgi:hypothetical protein